MMISIRNLLNIVAFQDLKYAVRLLSKKPGFTILTTLVMAAGIGLSIYLFSFFNTIVFKDLPFKDSDSLVSVLGARDAQRTQDSLILHDYYEIKTNLKGMSEFGAYKNMSANVTGRDGVRQYSAVAAEPNIFQITRTKPILGREFSDAENQVGAEYVVVIGFDLWQNQFGGDAKAIDQTLHINGNAHRIIGVMPQGYLFPNFAELWVPLRQDATKILRGKGENIYGIAHLNEGVTTQDIDRQLNVIMQRIEEQFPKTNSGLGAYVTPIPQAGIADGVAVVYSMHIIAILILILAAINVGNLLLSRAIERSKETAIRLALGAPRSRLISQMLWESIIICSLGGIIGLLVTAWGLEVTEAITATFFDAKPFWFSFGLDSFTIKLFFCFLLFTILATGLLPAWKNSGADFNTVLRDGTRDALGKKSGRLNRLLVISEICISLTVLIAAGVMAIASYITTHADFGADSENILTAKILLPESTYSSPESQVQFVKTLESRLENSVGISDVMISSTLPGDWSMLANIALEGKEYSDKGYPKTNYIVLTSGSLAKLGVALKEGRYFDTSDEGLEKNSAIVTDSFIAQHFAGESAIGKRIRIVDSDTDEIRWLTIVGVVEHTIHGDVNRESGNRPSLFRPFSQAPRKELNIALKMTSDMAVATRTLRKTLESIDPKLPAYAVETYAVKINRVSAPVAFITTIFLLFGIAAVVLAASGIYGVMSNTIHQRTQEIGVKRALGAMDKHITQEFLMTGFKQLLWGGIPGIIAGSAMAYALSKIMAVGDGALIMVVITITTIISGVVMLATWLPTKRALQMEPSEALRCE